MSKDRRKKTTGSPRPSTASKTPAATKTPVDTVRPQEAAGAPASKTVQPAKQQTGAKRRQVRMSAVAEVPPSPADTDVLPDAPSNVQDEVPAAFLTDHDVYLFNEGTHRRLYEKLGAHPLRWKGRSGTYFAVWAPSAASVSVTGDFNEWNNDSHPLMARGGSGLWEGFFADVPEGTMYKYHIVSQYAGYVVDKTDPFGFAHEVSPNTASITWDLSYTWSDDEWMTTRAARQSLTAPMSVYEVHLGSWMRDENGVSLQYRDIAQRLAKHVKRCGFTHVELLPVMEHPFYGSWGYQVTGFFAPTSRYGTPQDFMSFVDTMHQEGIGVILDWVPSHFPTDEHGLGYFDGTHLFEHADPRQGYHPDWKSLIFNYGRNEVRSFLLSSACFWLDRYHADGIRVDAVASMLYLDYSRSNGEWVANRYGGRDNLEAIHFLRELNTAAYEDFPGIQMIAEESTAWPMVSRPTYVGGLGFGMKWDMGWMHDTLKYLQNDPIHRRFHHGQITFRSVYAFSENFMLPLSHDEVVHGKGSLINKMPGDQWKKFANLRLLYAYMTATPGKKLLFMGAEIAQWREWNHDSQLDWDLLGNEANHGILDLVSHLNRVYRDTAAMHELDSHADGFEWIDGADIENSVIAFLRKPKSSGPVVLCAFNFTPINREGYRLGVPFAGFWSELVNTDAAEYGGSGQGNMGGVESAPFPAHGRDNSIVVTLPPLGAVFFTSHPPPPLLQIPEEAAAGAEPPIPGKL